MYIYVHVYILCMYTAVLCAATSMQEHNVYMYVHILCMHLPAIIYIIIILVIYSITVAKTKFAGEYPNQV